MNLVRGSFIKNTEKNCRYTQEPKASIFLLYAHCASPFRVGDSTKATSLGMVCLHPPFPNPTNRSAISKIYHVWRANIQVQQVDTRLFFVIL